MVSARSVCRNRKTPSPPVRRCDSACPVPNGIEAWTAVPVPECLLGARCHDRSDRSAVSEAAAPCARHGGMGPDDDSRRYGRACGGQAIRCPRAISATSRGRAAVHTGWRRALRSTSRSRLVARSAAGAHGHGSNEAARRPADSSEKLDMCDVSKGWPGGAFGSGIAPDNAAQRRGTSFIHAGPFPWPRGALAHL